MGWEFCSHQIQRRVSYPINGMAVLQPSNPTTRILSRFCGDRHPTAAAKEPTRGPDVPGRFSSCMISFVPPKTPPVCVRVCVCVCVCVYFRFYLFVCSFVSVFVSFRKKVPIRITDKVCWKWKHSLLSLIPHDRQSVERVCTLGDDK